MASNIGPLIRFLRISSGLSQQQLAEKMGITYQQVQKYEYGKSQLTIKRLMQLAEALDVPPSTFIGGASAVRSPGYDFPADDHEIKALALFRGIKDKKTALKVLKALGEPQ